MATELPAIMVGEEPGQNPTLTDAPPPKAAPAPAPAPAPVVPADDDPDPFSTVFNQGVDDHPSNTPTPAVKDESKPGEAKKEEAPAKEEEPKSEAELDKKEPEIEADAESLTNKNWKRLKELHKGTVTEKEKEIETLKAQVAEATQTADPEEVKTIKEERDELLKRLEQVALERSPAFQSKHSKAIGTALATLKDAGGDKGAELEKIAAMGPGAPRKALLRDLVADEDGLTQGEIGAALAAYDSAVRAKDTELEDHRATIGEYSRSMSEKQAKESELTQAKRQVVLTSVLTDAKKNYASFQEIEGDATHNQEVKESEIELAGIINSGLEPDMLGVMYVLANEGKRVIDKVVPAKDAKIKELEATIAKLSGAGASPGGGTGSGSTSTKEPSFEDVFLQGM